jgi:hypothetical protein
MKNLILILLLLPFLTKAQSGNGSRNRGLSHCIFIGTNIGEFQSKGNYIVTIGNFKPETVFRDSSINIDKSFPYFQTAKGKILLSFIEKNYKRTSTAAFFNNLQLLIKKYYINHISQYVRNRRYDKTFYAFN